MLKIGILTASDRSFKGERKDQSGPRLKELCAGLPAEVVSCEIVPDEKLVIRQTLISMADVLRCEIILTTGGTGLGPRDVTPEATLGIIHKEVPGIAETLRAAGMQKKPMAMLSRGIAGVRGKTLIINLPGSPKAVEESFELLRPVLIHAVELIKGEVSDCQSSLSLPRSHSLSH